ncbi:MAG: hypothetical protein H6581_10795 [Bacteroidia bacterium]|nr:hypothetical protein [Bacteroidia bacterium]
MSGQDLVVGAILENVHDAYPDPTPFNTLWKGNTQYDDVSNRVILGIDHSNPTLFPSAFTVTLYLQVRSWNESGQFSSQNKSLSVSYNQAAGQVEKDKSVLVFNNGHKTEVEILYYTVSGGSYASIPDNVYLENEIIINRYDAFNSVAGTTLDVSRLYVYPDDELEVRWDFVPGAEKYDLEWTFVSTAGYTSQQIPNLEYDFQNNATRVRLSENYFRIPLTYEDGYLIYRIRAVGYQGVDRNQPVHSNWTDVQIGGSSGSLQSVQAQANHHWVVSWHEPDLNWQGSMTFAEEGRHSTSVAYFDGTLRQRQAVTQNREEHTAVVGETFYDHQGRPAVQTLPVPAFQPALKYHQNFTLSGGIGGGRFSRNDFDLSTNGTCDLVLNPVQGISGPGKYYSDNSLSEYSTGYFATTATTEQFRMQQFVPDADGFPFVQTTYMPDNTGRIRTQSGAGGAHKTGSGHESKYFYGDAEQEDLDRLLGSEAGFSTHYRKNMVVDANGQVAVSYLDPAGRVVVSALGGESPNSLIPLDNNVLRTLTKDLLTAQETNLDAGTLVATREFLVVNEGTHTFDYEMTGEQFTRDCISNPNFCYDCIYDLEISVKDDCGHEVLDGGAPFKARIGNISYDNRCLINPLTFDLTPYGGSLQASNLAIGKYSVTKKLTVVEEALQAYLDLYLTDNTCLLGAC